MVIYDSLSFLFLIIVSLCIFYGRKLYVMLSDRLNFILHYYFLATFQNDFDDAAVWQAHIYSLQSSLWPHDRLTSLSLRGLGLCYFFQYFVKSEVK